MKTKIFLPVLSGNKVSSKEVIISLLAYEHPLSAKKIHSRTKKNTA